MQKYIIVVNPRMDEDEISHAIGSGIAGAIFSISHQNYPLAAKLIKQVKDMSRKHNRPVSIIQDVSDMEDPLDLHFGLRSGVDWVASHDEKHMQLAKKIDKLAGLIFKGRNLPKGFRVDSVMAEDFLDPDASVTGMKNGQVKHLISDHKDQKLLDSVIHIGDIAGSGAIAVSDLDLAKALSFRRTSKKIIFAPKDERQANKGAILWGVHPMFGGTDFASRVRDTGIMHKGERVVDATDIKHVNIHLIL